MTLPIVTQHLVYMLFCSKERSQVYRIWPFLPGWSYPLDNQRDRQENNSNERVNGARLGGGVADRNEQPLKPSGGPGATWKGHI
jgi:hypothetical protein